jgi:hypothetical protein
LIVIVDQWPPLRNAAAMFEPLWLILAATGKAPMANERIEAASLELWRPGVIWAPERA